MDLTMLTAFNAKERSVAETVELGLVEIHTYESLSLTRSDRAYMHLMIFRRAKAGLKFETFWDCCDYGILVLRKA